ncbi:glycoside hydrolase [Nocardiopsis sp. CNR-923]|uniref:C40 family peptidase n=1 Tax=Nocardiopsis sp. CNR-923 TaxID=1904965 RepID=UPI00096001FB|nr:C40 family peptidase [Nocardiopsis sp. CNR-923]OLT26158.1 glycoside hydrolase [Nocardiopsis sp. CNR-923]
MTHSRHHEQIPACRPAQPGRQAGSVRTVARVLSATAATVSLVAAALVPEPALAHAAPASAGGGDGRVHQTLHWSAVETAIRAAESKKGAPYVWGGTGPNGFDCSGLVQWAFRQAEVELPRIAHDQAAAGIRIPYSGARRGDLVYWAHGGGYVYHVGIYLGGGRMIDAPKRGDHVRERDVMAGARAVRL